MPGGKFKNGGGGEWGRAGIPVSVLSNLFLLLQKLSFFNISMLSTRQNRISKTGGHFVF